MANEIIKKMLQDGYNKVAFTDKYILGWTLKHVIYFTICDRELVDYKRRTVGFVWQNNARNLLPYVTAWQNVQMPMLFDSGDAITIELYHILLELLDRLHRTQFQGHTLTLKVKYHDFTQITRSITSPELLLTKEQLLPLSKQLLHKVTFEQHPIRLLGLSIGNPPSASDTKPHREEWIDQYLPFEGE